jgi:hypothetical protein
MQILLFAGVAPARETPFGMVDAVGDAKRQGSARPGESLRKTPYLSLRQHADEPVAISTHPICTHLREIGLGHLKRRFLWSHCISRMSVGNDFQQPIEIEECAISNV